MSTERVDHVAGQALAVIARVCGTDRNQLAPTMSLYEDLGADSLGVMELVCALEEELGIRLPESTEFALSLRTVDDVVGAVVARARCRAKIPSQARPGSD